MQTKPTPFKKEWNSSCSKSRRRENIRFALDDFRINLHDSAILHALRTLGCTFLRAPTPFHSSSLLCDIVHEGTQAVHQSVVPGAGLCDSTVVEPVSLLTSFFPEDSWRHDFKGPQKEGKEKQTKDFNRFRRRKVNTYLSYTSFFMNEAVFIHDSSS